MIFVALFALFFSDAMGQTATPSVVGYAPVFIPGTNIPYVFSPVSKWDVNSDKNITGFARFVNTRGLYMYTPLFGFPGQFIIEPSLTTSLLLFSSTGTSIQPADFLPVYPTPSRSGVPITTKNIGVIPLYVSSKGEDKLRSLVSWALDSSGKTALRPVSSWDTIVYKNTNPPLFIESPKPLISGYLPKSTSVNIVPRTTFAPVLSLPAIPLGSTFALVQPSPNNTPNPTFSPVSGSYSPQHPPPSSDFPRSHTEPYEFQRNVTNVPQHPPPTSDFPRSHTGLFEFPGNVTTSRDDRKGLPVFYPVVTPDGFVKLVVGSPTGSPIGRIPLVSNDTASDIFIPVFQVKNS